MKKKWLSLLMVITMLLSMCMPSAVFAAVAPNDDGVTLETTLQDKIQQKGSKKTIDVIARAGDRKIDTRVYLNDDLLEATWSDANKDSYTLNFTKEGENTVLIQGIDGDYVKEITRTVYYTKAAPGEAIGHATFSLEGITIGAGYFIEPVKVEIHEGENAAQVLTRVLKEHGYSYTYTGNVENSFYLSSVANGGLYEDGCQEKNTLMRKAPVDLTGKVPTVLQNVMDDQGAMIYENDYVDEEGLSNELGEFCYSYMSGWMYSVNNVFPNVGFSGSYLGDGDVVRVQFTLYGYGADIGGGYSMGGESTDYYSVANKTDLVRKISEVNSSPNKSNLLAAPAVKASYDKAVELALQLDAPQAEVDSAVKSLDYEIKAYEKKVAEDKKAAADVDALIDAIGDVTLDSKAAIDKARAAYDALTADQKKYATKLPVLEAAEKKHADLKVEADKLAEDKKAAADADALIDAIGDVTLDSLDKINAATQAYNALTDDQKAHVRNLDKLNAAIEKYNALKAEADKPADKPNEEKVPSTGDENAILLYGLAIITAAGAACLARKKYNK